MSTPISPLEQLEQQTQTAPAAPSQSSTPTLSPLEQLEQQTSQPTTQQAPQSQDQGFLSGLYNSTLAPIGGVLKSDAGYAKTIYNEAGQHLANGEYLKAAGTLMSAMDGADDRSPLMQLFSGILDSHKEQVKATAAAYKAGHYTEAAGHGLAAALPVVGPMAAKAGEDIGAGKTGEGLGEAAGTIGAVLAPDAIGKAGDIIKGAPEAVKSATGFADVPDTVNADVQSGIKDVASSVADDAGVSPDAPSIRTQFEKLADGVESNSKGLYQQIDDATDGEFTNIQNKIKNVDYKLKEIAGTDDAAEEKLFNQKVALGTKMDEAIEAAKENGVAPEVADQAKTAWKQSSALRDVDAQVKASTFGNNIHAPEVVDPTKLATRLQKLADSGRLQEALGDEQADALLKTAYDGTNAAKDVAAKSATQAARRGLTTKLATRTAVGAGGFATYEGLKAAGILGGKK